MYRSIKGIQMATGKVKWFNNAKGYGFILSDEAGEDLFAHYSAIEMEGYKTLKAGQQVTFDITRGDKGLQAFNIKLVEEPAHYSSNSDKQYQSNESNESLETA